MRVDRMGWIESLERPMLDRPNRQVGVTKQRVTPELAALWLESTTVKNRKLSVDTVNRIAEDIRAGRFDSDVVNPIRFNTSNELTDGQHRLSAIVAAGIPVVLWCEVTDSIHIDEARSRRVCDVLTMRGDSLGRHLQSLATFVMRISCLRASGSDYTSTAYRMQFSRSSLIEFIDSTPLLHVVVSDALRVYQMQPRFGRAFGPAAVGTIIYYVESDIGDRQRGIEIMSSLASGQDGGKGDPIFSARRYLQSMSPSDRNIVEVPVLFFMMRSVLAGRRVDVIRSNMIGDVSKLTAK